jgi:hypothetical protein
LIASGVLLLILGPSARALAQACPPAVRLSGDRALIGSVSPALVDRGIALDAGGCLSVSVNLERRGHTMIVSIAEGDDSSGGPFTRRAVTDARTAATVIESWVRTDLEAPLLARRQIAGADPRDLGAVAMDAAPPARARGIQVFAAGETAWASDRSRWLGLEVGGCVMLGPVCGSARARFAAVLHGPGRWANNLDRHGVELLLGAELPLRLGAAVMSPGLALGVGWIHTFEEGSSRGEEIGGLRAEGRLALAWPVGERLALELALSLEITQAEHVEISSPEPLPIQPRWLGRLGAGLRFAGL